MYRDIVLNMHFEGRPIKTKSVYLAKVFAAPLLDHQRGDNFISREMIINKLLPRIHSMKTL